ncbi:hypothetical protein BU26DRAFT_600223 [Trematosphaeria pertusa]|uniref:Uncharacterized protein n=1 Tax=Trematosphaeria pertusa TaxID=390896 RepID=A0A6A6IVU1_9PLEO|nr:uncharacterized protein BU26DRAFT_600223 [Trematosphaeria pertusa]KAF2254549.1 hypothetical protein BU26DRAFT_600223 [Trematosphaeria pertusa]
MAAFSRGLPSVLPQRSFHFPSSIRAAIFKAQPRFTQSHAPARSFSSSVLHRYQSPASSRSFVSSDPVLRTVIQTREPVLLYKEPANKWYLWKVYGLACTCVGIGLYNWKFAVELPKDMQWFVPPTYYVIGFAMLAIGFHVFTRPVRRIHSLEIIPNTMGGPLQLRIRARIAPFLKERVILADLTEATISEKTAPMVAELVEADRARNQRLTEGLEHLSILPRIWELAARWLEQKWTSFFLKFKFAVLRFGIAQVEVNGVKWKLDCSGWLLDEGRAIDRIIIEE